MTTEKIIKGGQLYDSSPENIPEAMTEKLDKCKELLYDFNNSRPSDLKYRDELLTKILAEKGDNCYIEPPLHANWGCNTHIGKDFYANFNMTLVDDTDIYIGDNVMIAPNVVLAGAAHPICPELREKNYQYNLPIHIGNRVWIGAGSVVLPGITIGDNSVIGAGSVVTKDIPAGVVAVGNPCRVIRKITERDYEYYYKDKKIEETIDRKYMED